MARVPSYDNFQVSPTTVPQQRFDAPQSLDIAGRQAQQLGESMQRAGEGIGRIAIDMQTESNQLRAIDASNQAKEKMFDLMYHPETGMLNQKGQAAMERSSGKDLATEYADKFKDVTGEIAGSLGNDAQRKLFMQQAASMQTQLYGEAERHLAGEFKAFKVSTYDGTISTAKREIAIAGLNGGIVVDAETGRLNIDDAADRVIAASREKARFLGLSQTQADTMARKDLSDAHALAIEYALGQKKPEAADLYLKRYKDQMDGDDLVRVRMKIDGQVSQQIGMSEGERVFSKFVPKLSGSPTETLVSITAKAESGNRQVDKNGNVVVGYLRNPDGSFKLDASGNKIEGGVGVMQVTRRTGPEAAKMAGLEWDESKWRNDADYNRKIGSAYLTNMLRQFDGDEAKMWAAYNAGPGAVQKAMKAEEKNKALGARGDLSAKDPSIVRTWVDFLPEETQKYVKNNMAELARARSTGSTGETKPTLQDIHAELRNSPLLAGNPDRLRIAMDQVKQRFDDMEGAIKQRGTEVKAEVQRQMMANGGRWNDLPQGLRDQVAQYIPGEFENLRKFGNGNSVSTDWNLYSQLRGMAVSDPAKFGSYNLTSDFDKLAPGQRETLLDMQTAMKDPSKRAQAASLEQQLTTAHGLLKLGSSDHEGKGKFDDAVHKAVQERISENGGKPLTYEERDKIISRMMLKVSGAGWSADYVYQLNPTNAKDAKVAIPDADRTQIVETLKKRDKPITEANIRAMFNQRYGIN